MIFLILFMFFFILYSLPGVGTFFYLLQFIFFSMVDDNNLFSDNELPTNFVNTTIHVWECFLHGYG